MNSAQACRTAYLLVVRSFGVAKCLGDRALSPTLTVAKALAVALQSGFASDLEELKRSVVRKLAADASAREIENSRKVAEASVLAGKARHADALARVAEAKADQAEVQTFTLRLKALDAARRSGIDEAMLEKATRNFVTALATLRMRGGDLIVSSREIDAIIATPPVERSQEEAERPRPA